MLIYPQGQLSNRGDTGYGIDNHHRIWWRIAYAYQNHSNMPPSKNLGTVIAAAFITLTVEIVKPDIVECIKINQERVFVGRFRHFRCPKMIANWVHRNCIRLYHIEAYFVVFLFFSGFFNLIETTYHVQVTKSVMCRSSEIAEIYPRCTLHVLNLSFIYPQLKMWSPDLLSWLAINIMTTKFAEHVFLIEKHPIIKQKSQFRRTISIRCCFYYASH